MTECISIKVGADIYVQRLFPPNISHLIPLRPDDDLHVVGDRLKPRNSVFPVLRKTQKTVLKIQF